MLTLAQMHTFDAHQVPSNYTQPHLLSAPADTQRLGFYDLYQGWEEDGERKRLRLSELPWLGGDPKFMRKFDRAFSYFRNDLDRRGNLRRWTLSFSSRVV